ncbi:Hypothetical protein EPM1_2176 [Stenotrophomonas maltophilia EPM1]|nr:Hypothetical protein EPM1_2176 [Stenotrophomonas maltophilia EPM1]
MGRHGGGFLGHAGRRRGGVEEQQRRNRRSLALHVIYTPRTEDWRSEWFASRGVVAGQRPALRLFE